MLINLKNAEILIFQDKKIMEKLPDLHSLYNQWLLGVRQPALKFLAQKAILKLLEKLSESNYINILEKYFNEKIEVKSIDYHPIKNLKVSIQDAEKTLNSLTYDGQNVSISRDAEYCYISIWK